MSANELTNQQRLFCERYAVGYSGVESAIAAGYGRSGASVRASELLRYPTVQAYLGELRGETKDALGLEAKNIARSLMDIVTIGIGDVAKWDGKNFELLPIEQWPFEAKTAVKKANISIKEFEQGRVTNITIELESKIAALDSLAKMLGLYQGFDTLIAGLEAYGLRLQQDSQGEWRVEKVQK
jgi:phage terminase small subunit